jgi:YD repeat-containing protein
MERDYISACHCPMIELCAAIDGMASPGQHHSNLNSGWRVFAYLALIVVWFLSLAAWPLPAQGAGAQFVYDPAGRLVQVIAPDGTSAQYSYDLAGNLLAVTPLSASTADVTGFSASTGAAGGTSTIYGSGFSTNPSDNLVYFNGVAATVVSSTTNSLTVIIPNGATTGPVTVTDSNGTVQSAGNFVVSSSASTPTISSFSPQIVQAGTAVTIYGSNFQNTVSDDKVSFAKVVGTVTSASPTVLTTTVPPGTVSGRISVATPGGIAVSAGDFFMAPPGYAVSDIGGAAPLTIDGPPQTIAVPTAGQIGMAVFDGTEGQLINLSISAQTFPSNCQNADIFLDAPGAFGYQGSSSFCTGSTTFTLPTTGAYTLLILPGADTGSITMRVASTPLITGAIAVDGAPVTVTTTVPGQRIALTFAITTPGEVVNLQPSGVTFPSGCAAQTLTIEQQANADAYIASGDLCSAQGLTLPVGMYVLKVVPYGSDTGSVTLRMQSVQPIMGSIPIDGSAVTETTTSPGQRIQLTFVTTNANASIAVQPSGVSFSSGCYNGVLTITGPTPAVAELLRKDLCTARAVMLAGPGTYTLTVIPYGTDVGSVTLQLNSAPTVMSAIAIDGPPVTVTTTLPAQQAQLTLTTTTANQEVGVQLSACTFGDCSDAVLQVSGPPPANTYLASIHLSTSMQIVTLPSVGTNALTLIPYDTDLGAVTVALQNIPTITAPISIDGAPVTVTTTLPGQPIQFVFSTTNANQNIVVQPLNFTFPSGAPSWTVTGPTLASTAGDYVSYGNFYYGQTVTLASAGTYALTVVPVGTDTGSVTLQLQTKPPPLTGTISIDGGAVTSTTTASAQDIMLTTTTTSLNERVSVQASGYTFSSACNLSIIHVQEPPGFHNLYPGSVSSCPGLYGVQLAEIGTYTLDFQHWYPDTGSLTLQLAGIHDVTGTIQVGGDPVTATTTVPLQNILLTFSIATANQSITVQPSGSTFPSDCSYQTLKVTDATSNATHIYGNLCNPMSTQMPIGTYTLSVIPSGPGSVTLQITSP